jgi:hypothetical protein
LAFDRLPCSSRASATATLAAAAEFKSGEPIFERAPPVAGEAIAQFEHS